MLQKLFFCIKTKCKKSITLKNEVYRSQFNLSLIDTINYTYYSKNNKKTYHEVSKRQAKYN